VDILFEGDAFGVAEVGVGFGVAVGVATDIGSLVALA